MSAHLSPLCPSPLRHELSPPPSPDPEATTVFEDRDSPASASSRPESTSSDSTSSGSPARSPVPVADPSSDVLPSSPISTVASSSLLPLHHPIPRRPALSDQQALLLQPILDSIETSSDQHAPAHQDDLLPADDSNKATENEPSRKRRRRRAGERLSTQQAPSSPTPCTQEGAFGVSLDEPLFADRTVTTPPPTSRSTLGRHSGSVIGTPASWHGDVFFGGSKTLKAIRKARAMRGSSLPLHQSPWPIPVAEVLRAQSPPAAPMSKLVDSEESSSASSDFANGVEATTPKDQPPPDPSRVGESQPPSASAPSLPDVPVEDEGSFEPEPAQVHVSPSAFSPDRYARAQTASERHIQSRHMLSSALGFEKPEIVDDDEMESELEITTVSELWEELEAKIVDLVQSKLSAAECKE